MNNKRKMKKNKNKKFKKKKRNPLALPGLALAKSTRSRGFSIPWCSQERRE
jgi:hypothetical protein